MMLSAVTVSLVPEVRGGPFVFWDDLPRACKLAGDLGFDAIEVFPPDAESIDRPGLKHELADHGLKVAAVGTGAGWVKHRLALTAPEAGKREQARAFVRSIIELAGEFGAPAIIGSMQGRHGADWLSATEARARLTEALVALGEQARSFGVPLLYEPLNRYETNLCCRLADAVSMLKGATDNVKLLADLFHMNIEEDDTSAALSSAGEWLGHIHFVDSNRKPAGLGQINYAPIAAALQEVGYSRYLSAEAFSVPDDETAARLTIEAFRKYFR